jgi:hypothetical protein
MFDVIAQGILDDPTMSFLAGLIIVVVIGWATRNYLAKKNQ